MKRQPINNSRISTIWKIFYKIVLAFSNQFDINQNGLKILSVFNSIDTVQNNNGIKYIRHFLYWYFVCYQILLYNMLPQSKISGYRNSKVTPIGVRPKRNNFVPKRPVSSIQAIKYQICAALLFGINRLYLLNPNRFVLILSLAHTIFMPILVWGIMFNADELSATYFVFKYTCCVEYILLITISLFTSRNKLRSLFRDLDKFDEMLNISKDLNIVDSGYASLFWLSGCLFYSLCEYIGCYFYLSFFIDRTVYCFYIMMLSHDCEQILFFVLLRTIYARLSIIKAHVLKVFSSETRTDNYRRKLNKVEALSNNAQLDISSLHRVYDLLHKCAEQLNSIMSLSVSFTKNYLLIFMLNIVPLSYDHHSEIKDEAMFAGDLLT